VVEAELERVLDGDRAAEAHASVHRKLRAPLEQEAHELEEILVPAHRDAVLGDASESRHDAVVKASYSACTSRIGSTGTRLP